MTTHSILKPFKCKQCEKSFKITYSLSDNMLRHTGKNLRNCKGCDKRGTVTGLKIHMQIHTEENLEKPYICDLCDQTFRSQYLLDSHLMNHTGVRPFKCNICLKKFKTTLVVKVHT